MKNEYVIWGIPPGQSEETLLVTQAKGKPIHSKPWAESLAKLLESKYGARHTRVQEVCFADESLIEWRNGVPV